jgi:hypothetical protein
MILVSEHGRVREILSPLDAKTAAARDDFRRAVEDQFYRIGERGRQVAVPVGYLHREPKPKIVTSRGISEQLAEAK